MARAKVQDDFGVETAEPETTEIVAITQDTAVARQQAITALDALTAAGWTPPGRAEPVAWAYVNTDGECEQIEWGAPPNDPSIIHLFSARPVSNTGREGE
jgi:hypothetical protein